MLGSARLGSARLGSARRLGRLGRLGRPGPARPGPRARRQAEPGQPVVEPRVAPRAARRPPDRREEGAYCAYCNRGLHAVRRKTQFGRDASPLECSGDFHHGLLCHRDSRPRPAPGRPTPGRPGALPVQSSGLSRKYVYRQDAVTCIEDLGFTGSSSLRRVTSAVPLINVRAAGNSPRNRSSPCRRVTSFDSSPSIGRL